MSKLLACSGALPFILCALCLVADISDIPLLGSTSQVLSIYGLVIASFMAGVHWGQHLTSNTKASRFLAITSNINAILLWLAFLLLSFPLFIVTLIISFLVLLIIDKQLYFEDVIESSYFYTRVGVTLTVVLCLLISGVSYG